MINRAIARLWVLFALLFIGLIVRQAYVQLVAGPQIAARPGNPRRALPNRRRGSILATDGTILAKTVGAHRVYPLGRELAQIVGYDSARYGTSGIEAAYDRALSPAPTSGDPAAQVQALLAALRGSTAAVRGANVVTTIVPAIQRELYADLAAHARAAGVVLDPHTGAVLAIASVPSFDPNTLAASFPRLLHDSQAPLLDRALDGLYPPGSTFKIFTSSAALDTGAVTLHSTFYDPGYYYIGKFRLHNAGHEVTGRSDLTRAFALSVNVDYAQVALRLGLAEFYRYLHRWQIGSSLDFQLPTEPARYPPESSITPSELAQMGFGQGALLVSPLQMALIAATVANGGVEPRPYIVRQIVRAGAVASTYSGGTLSTPISAETAAEVTKMMLAVVRYGTGTSAALPGVLVAGKTGTATNPRGVADSWFVCFAPAQAPKAVVAIVVENAGYGAAVAAPIARDVMRIALQSMRS
ncbi:MAG: peptidoglycan D,D-transpeptidase FtsI family protein [Vulcanimicrobiaceae bacterium]